ncbi:helix-turn-helix domain-containing protein [Streptomyces sp. NPDC056361]|uniref:helix-turn-helix domain-containing protein n=1 Tax=Streptomyces sp. NPDC056361 TaxID=3345795 RepID=UPI0035D904FA
MPGPERSDQRYCLAMPNSSVSGVNAGARVRALRAVRGHSLRAFADMLGVSPATLSHIETGKVRLSVDRLERIAELLGTTVEGVLTDRTDAMDAPAPRRRRGDMSLPPAGWRDYPPLELDPVLTAALAEFVRAGYHGTSVRDIARAAGLSVSGLYHYHSSKQDMLQSILHLTMSDLLERSSAARDEGSDPVERFTLLVEHLVLWHTYRRTLGFVGASEMRSLEPRNRHEIAAMRIAQQRMVEREVEAAVHLGRFTTLHPHEATRAVVTMCVAIPSWYQVDGPLSPEQIAAQYIEFALDVMRPQV